MNALPKAYHEGRAEPLMVLFKIISRHSWDKLQDWKQAHPGSKIEHLEAGLFVLHIPAGRAMEVAA